MFYLLIHLYKLLNKDRIGWDLPPKKKLKKKGNYLSHNHNIMSMACYIAMAHCTRN